MVWATQSAEQERQYHSVHCAASPDSCVGDFGSATSSLLQRKWAIWVDWVLLRAMTDSVYCCSTSAGFFSIPYFSICSFCFSLLFLPMTEIHMSTELHVAHLYSRRGGKHAVCVGTVHDRAQGCPMMKGPAACVSLLGSATLGCDRMQ